MQSRMSFTFRKTRMHGYFVLPVAHLLTYACEDRGSYGKHIATLMIGWLGWTCSVHAYVKTKRTGL